MTFPEKLQLIRKHHDLSQEELAERLGVTRQTVSRWEAGQSMPDIDRVLLISQLFSVSTDYLLNDKIDNSTSTLTDYQTLRLVFWISTALIVGGLIISIFGWREYQNLVPVIIGMLLEIVGCVCFEVFHPRNADAVLIRYAHRQFYAVNVWLLLPTPFYIAIELLFCTEHMKPLMPYLIGAAIYLIVAASLSLYLIYKFRH